MVSFSLYDSLYRGCAWYAAAPWAADALGVACGHLFLCDPAVWAHRETELGRRPYRHALRAVLLDPARATRTELAGFG